MWGYGNNAQSYNMMGWGGYGWTGLIGFFTWAVLFIDLVLLGMWLWKQIKRK